MQGERRIPTGRPASRAVVDRVQVARALSALPFDDLAGRRSLLEVLLGPDLPVSLVVLPPVVCDHGLAARFGEQVFINQGCFFSDVGGITLGDRVLVGLRVPFTSAGHPVEPASLRRRHERADRRRGRRLDRRGATLTPGVTIGRGSVVGAGAVVAVDVPPMSLVTGTSLVQRRRLGSPSAAAGELS